VGFLWVFKWVYQIKVQKPIGFFEIYAQLSEPCLHISITHNRDLQHSRNHPWWSSL